MTTSVDTDVTATTPGLDEQLAWALEAFPGLTAPTPRVPSTRGDRVICGVFEGVHLEVVPVGRELFAWVVTECWSCRALTYSLDARPVRQIGPSTLEYLPVPLLRDAREFHRKYGDADPRPTGPAPTKVRTCRTCRGHETASAA